MTTRKNSISSPLAGAEPCFKCHSKGRKACVSPAVILKKQTRPEDQVSLSTEVCLSSTMSSECI